MAKSEAGARRRDRWIIWQQHWVGYEPIKFGTHYSKEEAEQSAARLNASPSGQWYSYHVEFVETR